MADKMKMQSPPKSGAAEDIEGRKRTASNDSRTTILERNKFFINLAEDEPITAEMLEDYNTAIRESAATLGTTCTPCSGVFGTGSDTPCPHAALAMPGELGHAVIYEL